jgi:hypothetical protein
MIKAVLEKNEEDYNRQIKILLKDDNSKYSQLKAHIEYISKHNDNEEFDKISKIITILLQEKFVFEGLQDWYSASLNSIDTNTDEGKKWRQKNQEDCFSMQILYSVDRHVKKVLQQKIPRKLPKLYRYKRM